MWVSLSAGVCALLPLLLVAQRIISFQTGINLFHPRLVSFYPKCSSIISCLLPQFLFPDTVGTTGLGGPISQSRKMQKKKKNEKKVKESSLFCFFSCRPCTTAEAKIIQQT